MICNTAKKSDFFVIKHNYLQSNKLYDNAIWDPEGKKTVCFLPLVTNIQRYKLNDKDIHFIYYIDINTYDNIFYIREDV